MSARRDSSLRPTYTTWIHPPLGKRPNFRVTGQFSHPYPSARGGDEGRKANTASFRTLSFYFTRSEAERKASVSHWEVRRCGNRRGSIRKRRCGGECNGWANRCVSWNSLTTRNAFLFEFSAYRHSLLSWPGEWVPNLTVRHASGIVIPV